MTTTSNQKLVTLADFKKMSPFFQGYAVYMQADLPGSELKCHQENPYPEASHKWEEFKRGEFAGMLEAQDSEG